MTETVKLSKRAEFLLPEIAAGRDRIFYDDDAPPGWKQLSKLGFAVQSLQRECTAVITDAGRAWLLVNVA